MEKEEGKTEKKIPNARLATLFLATSLLAAPHIPEPFSNIEPLLTPLQGQVIAPEIDPYLINDETTAEIMNDKKIPQKYKQMLLDVSREFGMNPVLVSKVIKQESKWNPRAVSRVGAKGLMQLMPSTAEEQAEKMKLKNYDIFDAHTNMRMGTAYLSRLMHWEKVNGNTKYGLFSYNYGYGNLKKFLKNGKNIDVALSTGKDIPNETRQYIINILDLEK